MRNIPNRVFGGLAIFLLAAMAPAMSVHAPQGNDPQGNPLLLKHADCKGVSPGGTDLINAGAITALDVTTAWNTIKGDVQGQFGPNWTYAPGTTLGGDLYIDAYQAFDTETGPHCIHGAELLCHYENITVPGGKTIGWVQAYKKNGQAKDPAGYGDHAGWSFDPPPGAKLPSGKETDKAPLYHDKDEKHYHAQLDIPDAQIFWDRPQQTHPDATAWKGGSAFYLFLVSWDGSYDSTTPHAITLHDAFSWGFTGECTVPTPTTFAGSTALLALFGTTGIGRAGRHRKLAA